MPDNVVNIDCVGIESRLVNEGRVGSKIVAFFSFTSFVLVDFVVRSIEVYDFLDAVLLLPMKRIISNVSFQKLEEIFLGESIALFYVSFELEIKTCPKRN